MHTLAIRCSLLWFTGLGLITGLRCTFFGAVAAESQISMEIYWNILLPCHLTMLHTKGHSWNRLLWARRNILQLARNTLWHLIHTYTCIGYVSFQFPSSDHRVPQPRNRVAPPYVNTNQYLVIYYQCQY